MDRKAIKAKAKEFAFAHKWDFWKPFLLYMLACFIIGFVVGIIEGIIGVDPESFWAALIQTVMLLAILPMAVGLISYFIKLVKGEKPNAKEELFSKYSSKHLWRILVICILAELIVCGWTLLLIVPGIICAFKFAMTYYVLAEQSPKELKEGEAAYKVSTRLMDGHKWDYFVFCLSFIGWVLLCAVTLGIALIWFFPYFMTAQTMYYEELKKINK